MKTTLDPITWKDGDPKLGPKWSKVFRRITYNLHPPYQALDVCDVKGKSLEALTGPILGSKDGKPIDIVTEYFFIRGSWNPPDIVDTHAKDESWKQLAANASAQLDSTQPLAKAETKCEPVQTPKDEVGDAASQASSNGPFSDHALLTQAAMGCPLLGYLPTSAKMPLLPPELAKQLKHEHRDRIPNGETLHLNACVARPVGRASTPAALEAVAKEWNRLRSIKHKTGVGVWDESEVKEKRQVRRQAEIDGVLVHFARIVDLCVEKGSELPVGHKDRKFKGRAVLLGDQVKDQNWEAALFQDLSSSLAAMEASRAADAYGVLPGNSIEVSDADSARTQSYLEGPIKTWVSIPKGTVA